MGKTEGESMLIEFTFDEEDFLKTQLWIFDSTLDFLNLLSKKLFFQHLSC